jgi:penicillin-binding protein 1C
MNQPYQVAVKTGTSTRYRDCWAVAYSPEYTLAVWAGNFGGGPTANLSGASAAAPILADLARELFGESTPAAFSRPPGVAALNVCAFSGHLPGPGCAYLRRELFISGTEPDWDCSLHQPRDPYIRLATPFAGWLHQRFTGGGAGRYRLEGFSEDLNRVFPGTGPEAAAPAFLPGPPPPGGASPPTPLSGPDQALPVTITYPLAGDCFLLQAREEVIRLTAKASCRGPVSRVTWFVDGLEVGAGGPPYEVSLELGRGRHQLMAVGPEGAGDLVAVEVQ